MTLPQCCPFARWLLACAAIVGVVSPVAATVLLPVDFKEMVAESQLIVHGRVTDVRAYATAGRRTIESVVTIAVLGAAKGQPGPSVVLRLPHGRVGRYRRVMVGAPELVEGDEVVVFLKGHPPAVPMPFGLSQGVYRVLRDGRGRGMVTPLVADGHGRIVRGDPARRPIEVSAFVQQVRASLGTAR